MFAPKQPNNAGHHPSKNKSQEKKPFVLKRQGLNAGIQEKLKVGQTNDRFEKEAEIKNSEEIELINEPSTEIETEIQPQIIEEEEEVVLESESNEDYESELTETIEPSITEEQEFLQPESNVDGTEQVIETPAPNPEPEPNGVTNTILEPEPLETEESLEFEEEEEVVSSTEKLPSTAIDAPIDSEDAPTENRTTWSALSLYNIITEKLGLDYNEVRQTFREANGRHASLDLWVKKSIVELGWTKMGDPVPNIHEIKVEYRLRKDMGQMKSIPFIEAYSYEDAFAHAGKLGLQRNTDAPFYWVTKIYGTERKYRYNFSTREGYLNFKTVKAAISQTTLITKEYMQKGFFEDLKYLAGPESAQYYSDIFKKDAWNDRLLSNALVKLVYRSQQRQIDVEGITELAPTGIITTEFILYVKNYKTREKELKAEAEKRRKEKEEKAKKEAARKQEHREKYGEAIQGKEGYRRYYRGTASVDVVELQYRYMKSALKNRSGSNDKFFNQLDKRGAWNQLQKDIFFLLTVKERKTALYFFANASYLSDSREEPSLISLIQHTPSEHKNRIKGALNAPHGDFDKLQYALKANVSSGNTKELTIAIDNIVGYGKEVSKSDLTYYIQNTIYIYYEKVANLAPRQVHRLSLKDYKWFIEALEKNAQYTDRGEAFVNLAIYASSEQQSWLRNHLMEHSLKQMRLLKGKLTNELWGRLRFGETVKSGIDVNFKGQDQKSTNKDRRGSGMENLFSGNQQILDIALRILDGHSHTELTDYKATLATLPYATVKAILNKSEDKILWMLKLLTQGSASSEDEYAIIRVLKAVREVYTEKQEQKFYYTMRGGNGSQFGDLVKRMEKDMDDLFYEWKQIITDFNESGSEARIEKAMNADSGDVDEELAMMSDEDFANLSIWKRQRFINRLVGSDSWWNQFFTVTGDEDENSVIRLINTTPHEQVDEMYDYLYSAKGERFNAIQSAIDGAEYQEFHETLKNRNFQYLEQSLIGGVDPEADAAELQKHWEKLTLMRLAGDDYEHGKEQETKKFHFNDPGSVKMIFTGDVRTKYDLSFTNSGKLRITITDETPLDVLFPYLVPGGSIVKTNFGGKTSVLLDPMQLITVKHERDDADLGVSQGDVVTMPAVGLFYYKNKADNRTIMEFVDLALIIVSIATLGLASGPAMVIIGILEIVAAVSDILLRNFKEDMPPELAEIWETINWILMAPALVVGAVQVIKGAVATLAKFMKSAAFRKLSTPMQKVLKLRHDMNKRYADQIDLIKASDDLDELKRIEDGLAAKKNDPLAKSTLDEIEIRRKEIHKKKGQEDDFQKMEDQMKKQQEGETSAVDDSIEAVEEAQKRVDDAKVKSDAAKQEMKDAWDEFIASWSYKPQANAYSNLPFGYQSAYLAKFAIKSIKAGAKTFDEFLEQLIKFQKKSKLKKQIDSIDFTNLTKEQRYKLKGIFDELFDISDEFSSKLKVIKKGSEEWRNAVKEIRSQGKGRSNYRVNNSSEAQELLFEARQKMNRYKQYTYTKRKYSKGFEYHNEGNFQELVVGNDLPHIKWHDGSSSGHIFFEKM